MLETSPDLIVPLIWYNLCFILGLVANGWLLVATVRYRALQLDKISVWIVQNMAVLDIASCFALLLPMMIVQYGVLQAVGPSEFYRAFSIYGHERSSRPFMNNTESPGWVPSALCEAIAIYEYSFLAGNAALMSMLVVNKLTRCMFPFRNTNPGRKQLAAITLLVSVFSVSPAAWHAYINYSTVICIETELNRDLYFCRLWPCAELPDWYWGVSLFVCVMCGPIPFTIIVISNISLVSLAVSKSRFSLRRPGIYLCFGLTICLTVAYAPSFLAVILFDFVEFNDLLDKIRWNVSFLSCWISPLLCLLTNQHFRTTTLRFVRCNGGSARQERRMVTEPARRTGR